MLEGKVDLTWLGVQLLEVWCDWFLHCGHGFWQHDHIANPDTRVTLVHTLIERSSPPVGLLF